MRRVGDEWDPWKRYQRHLDRLYWDSEYRYRYHQDRLTWDPWYRHQYEQDRMQWDPWFRTMKEIEQRRSDPEHWFQGHVESRMDGSWYGERTWWDEYREKKERELIEEMMKPRESASMASFANSISSTTTATSVDTYSRSNTNSRLYYYYRSDDLPSMKTIVAEALATPILSLIFTIGGAQGWAVGQPLGLFILVVLASIFIGAISVRSMLALLITGFPLMFFFRVYNPFEPSEQFKAAVISDWQKATLISFIIAGVYIFLWWLKIRSEE